MSQRDQNLNSKMNKASKINRETQNEGYLRRDDMRILPVNEIEISQRSADSNSNIPIVPVDRSSLLDSGVPENSDVFKTSPLINEVEELPGVTELTNDELPEEFKQAIPNLPDQNEIIVQANRDDDEEVSLDPNHV
jgi:hypothetical protein